MKIKGFPGILGDWAKEFCRHVHDGHPTVTEQEEAVLHGTTNQLGQTIINLQSFPSLYNQKLAI
jgi:hypothetical protein